MNLAVVVHTSGMLLLLFVRQHAVTDLTINWKVRNRADAVQNIEDCRGAHCVTQPSALPV